MHNFVGVQWVLGMLSTFRFDCETLYCVKLQNVRFCGFELLFFSEIIMHCSNCVLKQSTQDIKVCMQIHSDETMTTFSRMNLLIYLGRHAASSACLTPLSQLTMCCWTAKLGRAVVTQPD